MKDPRGEVPGADGRVAVSSSASPVYLASQRSAGRAPMSAAGRSVRAGLGRWQGQVEGWVLVSPTVALLGVMSVGVLAYLIYISLYRVGSFGTPNQFVGGENYVDAFTVFGAVGDLVRTVVFSGAVLGLNLVIGGFLAFQLQKLRRAKGVVTALLLVPFAMTPSVSALIFGALLDPDYGWVDYYLRRIGLHSIAASWVGHPVTAWLALGGLDVWEWTPFVALVLFAGLQGLPREMIEAAEVDGANAWARLRYMVVPVLAPFIAIAAVIGGLMLVKTTDGFLVLTNGGPGASTTVANLEVYRLIVQDFDLGAGAAMAVLVVVVLVAMIPLLLRAVRPLAERERGGA